jgi:hypothetical protein
MSEPYRLRDNVTVSRTADGSLVIVAHLHDGLKSGDFEELLRYARYLSARAIWVIGGTIDPSFGFAATGGYARLEAPLPPAPVLLPSPPAESIRGLQTTCFAGIWGRYEAISFDWASRYVGLLERARWIGICQLDVIARVIDGRGVHPLLRTPERSAELVRGAAAFLPRNRPVTLETWGESAETLAAYQELGFEVVEELAGWERLL